MWLIKGDARGFQLQSKLCKGGYVGDYTGKYHRTFYGGY